MALATRECRHCHHCSLLTIARLASAPSSPNPAALCTSIAALMRAASGWVGSLMVATWWLRFEDGGGQSDVLRGSKGSPGLKANSEPSQGQAAASEPRGPGHTTSCSSLRASVSENGVCGAGRRTTTARAVLDGDAPSL